MNDWERKQLGEVCQIIGGGTPSKSNNAFYLGDIPWATVRDMKQDLLSKTEFRITKEAVKNSATNIIKKGNVVIATRVGLGRICKLEQDTAINQDLRGIIPYDSNDLSEEFLFWWFKSISTLIEKAGIGLTVQGVKLPFIKSLQISVPPLPEQKRVVAIVDNAFEGIDRAIANTEKNLTNARELFESYLNTAFTQKDDGWVEKKLGDIALLSRGQNPPKSKFVSRPQEGYVRFYQIRDGKTDDYEVYVPDTPQLHRVEPDDILMVAYRHIGRVFRGASGAFNVALCKIKNKDRLVLHDDYLFHIIPTDFVRGELMKQAERSLIPSMSVKHLAEIKIPVPPIAEQEIIVSKINKIQNETQRLEAIYQQKLAALNELKQTILQKAFTGELTADPANQATKTAEGAIAA